jgi:carbon starvation protein CstA
MTLARPHFGLIPLIWLVVGCIVAATHNYFEHLDSLRLVGSAILAVLLWPLLLLGIDLHIHR